MLYVAAILYVMGAFMYHLHQQTILYFTKEDNYSSNKVLFNSLIWPFRVMEIMLTFLMHEFEDDDEDDDQDEPPKPTKRKR